MKLKYWTTGLLYWLLVLPLSYGQTAISLEQAVELALVNNHQLQVSRAAVTIAENNDDWTLAGRYPQVNLTLNSNNSYNNTNNPASVVVESSVLNNGIVPGLSANWVLYNGKRVQYTKQQLGQQVQLSNEQLRSQIQTTIQSVTQAYYGALVQKEQLAVLSEILALSRDRIRYQEARRVFGQAVSFDLLQAQDAYLNDSTNYLIQQNTYATTLRNLALSMGQTGNRFVPSDELAPTAEAYEQDALRQALMANNPDLQASNVNIELARLNTRLQQADRLPSVNLSAGLSYNIANATGNQTFNFGGTLSEQELPGVAAQTFNGFLNLAASYPIWDGGLRRRRVETAELQSLQAQLNYTALEQQLLTQMENTLADYDNQRQLLGITTTLVANSRQNLQIAEERLRGGLINSFDYRSVQLTYINATQARLNAIFNLRTTEVELQRLVGGLVR
ncbi:MAG: TolC family protein [Bacteroidota bacterium]